MLNEESIKSWIEEGKAMKRREEILKVNRQWSIDVLIKLLAFVYEVKDFDNPIFEDLENIVELYLKGD